MKYLFSILLVLILWNAAFSQETGTYQASSIYKSNHVKARKWFSGTNKAGGTTTYYDREGRLTKFEVVLNMGASINTTHYVYDQHGKLITQVDSTINGQPDKKEIKRLKKMGINPSLLMPKGNKPPLEVSKYELLYEGDKLLKRIKYNPDGSLDIVDRYEQGAKVQVRDWYRNGQIYRQSTTEFITEFHKKRYYGWAIEKNGQKREWSYLFEYEFDDEGNVLSYTRYENGEEKETVRYSYNKNGLLIKTEGYYPEYFEYEYYE